MFNSLFRLVIPTVAFCTISGAALAQVSTCTFEKVTSNGFSTDNKKRTLSSLGEAFKFDDSRKTGSSPVAQRNLGLDVPG